ncbi:MAG: NAD(P)-dependent alcohol dehydrogenase [Acidobacteria bacterium]|nr:NAD(P)-dependent alcohol dehydrogenase [Acidobacteriota bacterium]
MTKSRGYAALQANQPLQPFSFERRNPGPNDLLIEIQYCGVCHSDLHMARNEWGVGVYPMVPGHEIVGRVTQVGSSVRKFKVGDVAGVGCFLDSCRTCENCRAGEEQYCNRQLVLTYASADKDGRITYGGYSNNLVVDENYALRISPKLDPAAAAPLLCAGITTYSPLKHWKIGKGHKVGVIGLGGLGHMALKLGCSFGARVVQFTTSLNKKADALKLGADEVVLSTDADAMQAHANSFDLIIDTVSAPHDFNTYISLLKLNGTLVLVGLPDKISELQPFNLVLKRRSLAGSAIGGIRETQEMLDYCAEHGIASDIELIPIQKINEAYERMLKSDVKYRFVIDLASLPKE